MKPVPEQLLNDLQRVKGFDKKLFIEAHQQRSAVSVRLHPLKLSSAFIDNEQVPWCTSGRYLDARPVFTLDPLYHAGAYYVQEASSMFLDHMIMSLLPERNGLRVLDLCAAPGGKSTLIASLLDEESLLISNEVIRTRASILEENITRWGYMNTWVTSNDARDFGKLEEYFDLMVVDAPCSGSGLFRKDEQAISEWSEANVQLCSQRQQRILADAWPSLKQNGILIYATCSYSPQEDEEILDWMANELDVETLDVELKKEWGIVETTSQAGMKGYRFFPDKVKGEGFFIAAVRKKEEERSPGVSKYKSLHDKKIYEQASYLLKNDQWTCVPASENYVAIHPKHEADYHLLKKYVYLRKAGLSLGTPGNKEWVPSHEIALSVDRSETIPAVELNKEQALRFLKKEEIAIPDLAKGWYVITYEKLGLGWIKALDNRFNNYLPKHWRIRMDINEADWR